ncbi:VanZ family protein [Aliidiomarina indica]|uniref:VanZ family protein n=1 Tax=Aliidiomarina indica TaxID=2749147 RepID=UPI002F427CE8
MFLVSRILFACIMLGVSVLFLMQSPPTPGAFQFPHADKIVHFGLFFVLAASFHIAFRPPLWFAWISLFIYAVAIELIQYYIPGRGADIWDVVADMVGVAAFYAVRKIFLYLLSTRKRRRSPS